MDSQFTITALSGALVAVMSVGLTFLFTMFLSGKSTDGKVEVGIKTHRAIDHKKDVEEEVEEHEDKCQARQSYVSTQSALHFLVKQAGGNPQEMGLTK